MTSFRRKSQFMHQDNRNYFMRQLFYSNGADWDFSKLSVGILLYFYIGFVHLDSVDELIARLKIETRLVMTNHG